MTVQLDPETVRALVDEVRRPREAIEAAFVSAGDRLSEGASLLHTLTRLFEALPGNLQGESMAEAVHHLEAVSARAQTLSERFDFEKSDLDSLTTVVKAAAMPIDSLRRTIKMMGIVSINARVTAAGIVGDDDDFEVFTADIKTLSEEAHTTIQQFALIYRQLAEEVGRAASQRSIFEGAHSNTLTSLGQKLSQALLDLNAHQQSAAQSSAETSTVGRQITGRIGSTVMALQVGDSTRQRLEHVEALLDGMATLCQDGTLLGETIGADDVPACTALLSVLQDELFADCVDVFADEVNAAQHALRSLVADASVIISLTKSFQGGKNADESTISNLSFQLGIAVNTVNNFENERSKLEATSTSVQRLVKTLLEHVSQVQDIESSMHLVSLNTAVRCAQMGPRGAPLTIIAMQLRELTGETVEAAQAAMAELTQATEFASKLRDADEGAGDHQVGELEAQAKAALTIITDLDQRISTALKQLNSDAPRVIRLLEAAERGLEGQTRLVDQLDEIKEKIETLRSAETPAELPEAARPLFAKLRKLYTMEAERQIHDRIIGAPVAPPAAAPAAVEDDIFFGFDEPSSGDAEVDLFTEEPAVEAASDLADFDFFGETEAAPAETGLDDFEFFGDDTPPAPVPTEAKKAEPDDIDDLLF